MKKMIVCICCHNPQILFFTDTSKLNEEVVQIIGDILKELTRDTCSATLKASGACYTGSAIVISESDNFPICRMNKGGRFGLGYLSYKIMERQGFQWRQEKLYMPETWHSPTGKKIEGIYLM